MRMRIQRRSKEHPTAIDTNTEALKCKLAVILWKDVKTVRRRTVGTCCQLASRSQNHLADGALAQSHFRGNFSSGEPMAEVQIADVEGSQCGSKQQALQRFEVEVRVTVGWWFHGSETFRLEIVSNIFRVPCFGHLLAPGCVAGGQVIARHGGKKEMRRRWGEHRRSVCYHFATKTRLIMDDLWVFAGLTPLDSQQLSAALLGS
jgi:hypothetical protein